MNEAQDETARHTSEKAESVRLSAEGQLQIVDAILNPPAPTAALLKAAKRYRLQLRSSQKTSVSIRVHPWPKYQATVSWDPLFPQRTDFQEPRMDTDAHGLQADLSEAVLRSAFEIAKVLGAGFLEKVYERALVRELALRGVSAKTQVSFPVCYTGMYTGEYLADLVVEEKLIVELKCVERFANEHLAQRINYLKVSRLRGAAYQFPEVQTAVETKALRI
jgi:GxxExxY protein